MYVNGIVEIVDKTEPAARIDHIHNTLLVGNLRGVTRFHYSAQAQVLKGAQQYFQKKDLMKNALYNTGILGEMLPTGSCCRAFC